MPLNGEYDGSIVALLEQLRLTANLEGLAVLDLSQDAAGGPAAYSLGVAGAETTSLGQALLSRNPDRPSHTMGTDKRPVLACPWVLPPTRPGGLLLWRPPRARAWTEADHDLGASVAMIAMIEPFSARGVPSRIAGSVSSSPARWPRMAKLRRLPKFDCTNAPTV